VTRVIQKFNLEVTVGDAYGFPAGIQGIEGFVDSRLTFVYVIFIILMVFKYDHYA
jgi:hypothetical protein